jgi:hypothetical protein
MPNRSTLKRPDDRLLRKFRLGQIGSDTVRLYLERGYSLAICCVNCPRLMEWTPPELLRRYGKSPDVKIADIASRLVCSDTTECGSRNVAVFPHIYDEPWTWPPAPARRG